MDKNERYLRFLNERIKTASSHQTEAAYTVVKDQFQKIFNIEESGNETTNAPKYEIKCKRCGKINKKKDVRFNSGNELEYMRFETYLQRLIKENVVDDCPECGIKTVHEIVSYSRY